MMGFGYYGNGGSSSSSSNLSALAPPFTVDRSVSKPLSNPHVIFSESTYAAPFNSSLHNWVHPHSSTSRPDYFSNPNLGVDSIRATCVPASNAYRYSVSQPVSSQVTHLPPSSPVVSGVAHLPPLSPIMSAGNDAFTFGQSSDRMKNGLVDAKTYYAPHVAPAIAIEDDTPLVVLNEPTYDLLSTSHAAHLNGSSSLDDYTRSMSGLEYPARWGGFWNGLADGEQGKQVELDGSFCPKESNFAGSSIYKNYINQGDHTDDGLSTVEEASAVARRKSVDILGRDNCIGSLSPDHFNNKPFYEPKATSMVAPVDFSRTSFLGSTSVLPENPHPQVPVLEPVTNSWDYRDYRKPQNASYEKCFGKLDSSVDDTVSKAKSSPAIVIRPPASSPSSLGVNTVSLKNVTCTDNSGNIALHHLSNVEEFHIPMISECREFYSDTSQLGVYWQGIDHLSVGSSSTKKDELSNNEMGAKVADNLFRAKSELRVPHLNVEGGFNLAPNSTEAINSVDDSSEGLDHYNPAVDSPCWKGAITSRFSPFEVSEALKPHNLMGQIEAFNGFNLQGPQIFPLSVDDAVNVSSEKPNENTEQHKNVCGENGLLPSWIRASVIYPPLREHRSLDALKTGPSCQKLSSGGGVQVCDDNSQSKKDHSVLNSSKSDSNLEPSHTVQGFGEVKFTFDASRDAVEGTGIDISDVSGDGSSHGQYHLRENISCSTLSGDNASTKLTKQLVSESTPNIDLHMLINTMHDLSDLLLSQYSDGTFLLKEHDHETLKQVIANLDACMTKKAQPLIPSQESLVLRQGCFHFLDGVPDFHKSSSATRLLGKKMAAANVQNQFHCPSVHEDMRHHSISSNKDEKLPDFVSLGDGEETVNGDKMTQAIRKILDMNFHGEEESDPQTLLYKNLWLEAEAALCSITYRARFDHMKTEMAKFKLHKTQDSLENIKDIEKPSSSKVSSDLNMVDKVECEAKEDPVLDISIQDSFNISTMSHAAAIVDRFHILKRRYENSDSLNTKDGVKELSCKVYHDINTDGKLTPEMKTDGELAPEIEELGHSPNMSTTTHSDDVMARFLILKRRADNSNSMHGDMQQPPEEVDLGLADSGCEVVKEFHGHVMDDSVIQLPRINRLQNSLPAGFSDGSSSDWEHVLKEELPGEN